MSDEAPHRAFRLKLDVEADDLDSLIGYLRGFETELYCDKVTTGVSGGYSSGATYSLTVDPSITHDIYFERVDAWLASREGHQS